MRRIFIGCYVHELPPLPPVDAIVAVDVIRATTTAATALAQGRRCFPAADIEDALSLASRLEHPLLAGELGGNMPYGFDLNNSPADVAARTDVWRPMVLLSTSGTRLIRDAVARGVAVYATCLRNYSAQIDRLAERYESVALLGAASRGEFREEDQLCCAWVADGLTQRGFSAMDGAGTIVARWRAAPVDAIATGHSAEYLRNTDQLKDLRFILDHVDDIASVFEISGDELVSTSAAVPTRSLAAS